MTLNKKTWITCENCTGDFVLEMNICSDDTLFLFTQDGMTCECPYCGTEHPIDVIQTSENKEEQ